MDHVMDHVVRNVPAELSADRWTFTQGDVRGQLATIPARTGYLFVDADHGARFARWYTENLFPLMPQGTPVSVHDVFHGRRPKRFHESAVIIKWLAAHRTPYVTPSAARAPEVIAQLRQVKWELGTGARRTGSRQPDEPDDLLHAPVAAP
ncbi:class I SAM-dependent methyltransferase, partial [Streptomyces sp. CB02923]|uniref:class I SAM-dependent methyltransferase n=1 Tax=Streptomyces sp. CB02923 TaxID=1718985 RepID=UPI0019017BD7